jgi:hypothetical protein
MNTGVAVGILVGTSIRVAVACSVTAGSMGAISVGRDWSAGLEFDSGTGV